MKRRIVQAALVGAVALVASGQARANVAYGGGRVMPTVRIIPMFYGNTWTAADIASTRSYLTELADYVRGAKNPSGKQTLYAQYAVTGAQQVQLPHCFGCPDGNTRVLNDVEIKNVLHGIQQENSNFYDADEVFLFLPGPGYSTTAGSCGYRGTEGDGMYYAVVPRSCTSFKQTISRHVLDTATSANSNGWGDLTTPCWGRVWNFGNGDIALPWNNHVGACPPASTDPNTPFDAKQGEVLQVLVSNLNLNRLWHSIRYPNGWTAFGDVKAAVGSDPGQIVEVDAQSTLGVFNHVAVVTNSDNKMWHTIRTDSGWTPWVDVNAATGATALHFDKVSLANVNGDLHVCATTGNGGVQHAIRFQNGTWSGFGDVLGQTGSPGEAVRDLDCAGIATEMHIVMATNSGKVFHAIRFTASWSGLGDVEGPAGPLSPPNSAQRVSAAYFAGDLHVSVTGSFAQFHTVRHNAGSWTPFTRPPNDSAWPMDVSSAGTQDFFHMVWVDGIDRLLKHRTRDAVSNWSGVGDVNAATGFWERVDSMAASSSLGY